MGTKYRKSMEPSHQMLVPTVYNEVPSFLGVPVVQSKDQLSALDAAIIGIPSQAMGALEGRAIGVGILNSVRLRQASLKYGGYLPELGIDVLETINLGDYRDVIVNFPAEADEVFLENARRIDEKIGDILDAGAIPITVEAHPWIVAEAIAKRSKENIGIIFLDAHGDNLDSHKGSRWSFASWVCRVAEIKNVDMSSFVQIGLRGPRNFQGQVEWFKERGGRVFTCRDIQKKGMDEVIREALSYAKKRNNKLYLNLDFDVLDLGAAPGLDEPLGISIYQLLELLLEAGRRGVSAFNLEWFPTPAWEAYHQPAMPLYYIATWAILYLLAGEILRRKSQD